MNCSVKKWDSMVNIRISREKIQIFCIRFHKADFTVSIVAQMSDMAHGPIIGIFLICVTYRKIIFFFIGNNIKQI